MISYSKVHIFILAVLARTLFVFKGKNSDRPEALKKIGVLFLTNNLGDMIFATPLIAALKKTYPKTEIVVVGQKKNQQTLLHNPNVDSYVVTSNSILGLFKQFLVLKLDSALLLSPSPLELSLAYLSGTRHIVTFSMPKELGESRAMKLMKPLYTSVPFKPGLHYSEQYARLLTPFDITNASKDKQLFFSDGAKESIQTFVKKAGVDIKKQSIIALAPGAGTKDKQWPAERFAKLADTIYEHTNTSLFIVGGPGDQKEFEELQKNISKETKLVSCLHHSIDELKAFISEIDMIIANDSAPIYIAESFDKYTITIVGPTDENEHPPKGKKHFVVLPTERGVPELRAGSMRRGYDKSRAAQQIEKVEYEEVEKVVMNVLKKIDHSE